MNHKRLWTLGNKLRALEGKGVGDRDGLVMGSKEGMYCMAHWVLYASNESWNLTSKTRDVLYGDQHNIIKKYYYKKKKEKKISKKTQWL